MPDRIAGIASVEDLVLPPGRGAWAHIPTWFLRLPWLRNRRPPISLLRFAGAAR